MVDGQGRTALLFPGQASQYVGMGKDLFDYSAEVRHLYEMASGFVGEDVAELSFNGPSERLKRTRFTQPAILTHSLAVLTLLKEAQLDFGFDFAAGHSLGEYGALAACGVLEYADALRAVAKRAALMEEACVENPGTMAAIIGMDDRQVGELCEQVSDSRIVVPANFNSPSQIVVSGDNEAVLAAVSMAKEKGARKAVMLEVGGAFHSPLMCTAQEPLADFLNEIDFSDARNPVIINVTGETETSATAFRRCLAEQITSPVKWSKTMRTLTDNGVARVIEIGPGKVLSSLAKREIKPRETYSLDRLEDIHAFSGVTV